LFYHNIKLYSSEILPSSLPTVNSVYKQTFLAKKDEVARTCRHTWLNTWTWLGTLGPLGPP